MSECKIDRWGNKWWHNKKGRHRLNGPAVEFTNGDKFWWEDNKLHRLNGPAIEHSDGTKYWWINDEEYTREQYFKELKKYISKEEIFMLRLKYE